LQPKSCWLDKLKPAVYLYVESGSRISTYSTIKNLDD
jgi:hypothetical protein